MGSWVGGCLPARTKATDVWNVVWDAMAECADQ